MTFRAKAPTSTRTTTVDAIPRPGTRRPRTRSYSGVVVLSTTLKIQMIAATLMNSGTVTKKPVMKLRRSQCINGASARTVTIVETRSRRLHPAGGDGGQNRRAEHDAIPGERREAGAAHEREERPDHEQRRDERHHQADADLDRA